MTDDPERPYDEFWLTSSHQQEQYCTGSEQKERATITFVDDKTDNKRRSRAYIYIEKDALQDLWENKNAKISYVVEVELDEEPPVIEKVEQDEETA